MTWVQAAADPPLSGPLLGVPGLIAVWAALVVGAVVLGALGSTGGGARRWWSRVLPLSVLVAAVVTFAGALLVEKVLRPFPDAIPPGVYLWIGVGLLGVLLGAGGAAVEIRAHRPWRAVASVVALLLVVAAAAGHVNRVYAEFSSVGMLLGLREYRTMSLEQVTGRAAVTVGGDLEPGVTLESVWTPSPGIPGTGAVVEAPIPGAASGFEARPAQIYLPPAYFTEPRPLLPVLVLMAGQPGGPEDWIRSGRLPVVADEFAADHAGLAPVIVVADPIGSSLANTLCVDSPQGNAHTYLARDVPGWIRATLQVDEDPGAWAIGGLSFGGTCALQLALTEPEVYPNFLAMSAQAEPTVGTRAETVARFFGGDPEAFRAANPADLLASRPFPDLAGAFVVGSDDTEYGPGVRALHDATMRAGADVRYAELPGGHSYAVWSEGLRLELPWLARRMGLIA
ncbi:alpha/beta hydrolase family protein [uncultured Dietzia sp.]|uniref:alpha/beta hydrolase n=1 Tax=uncultured Dietzia sp. TaxID=395519 RepID=UPI0025D9ABA3|nr:alpha/beta hydrolase-fold protein [uncultured Dietzia sp.]